MATLDPRRRLVSATFALISAEQSLTAAIESGGKTCLISTATTSRDSAESELLAAVSSLKSARIRAGQSLDSRQRVEAAVLEYVTRFPGAASMTVVRAVRAKSAYVTTAIRTLIAAGSIVSVSGRFRRQSLFLNEQFPTNSGNSSPE